VAGSKSAGVGVATGATGVASGKYSKRTLKEGKRWDELGCKDIVKK